MQEIPTFLQEGRVWLVDKPLKWTSFDVVNKIRYRIKKTFGLKKVKVGHAGTLDPLATGLMLICVGKATKKAAELTGLPKTYTGHFTLGATTPSYDLETPVDQEFDTRGINEVQVKEAASTFLGSYEQYPPAHSAKRVNGERAYNLARRGEDPKLKPKTIQISNFQVEVEEFPVFSFSVECSSGTYIRSLVHDLGKKLNNGAYLRDLKRTHIESHELAKAFTLEELLQLIDNQQIE